MMGKLFPLFCPQSFCKPNPCRRYASDKRRAAEREMNGCEHDSANDADETFRLTGDGCLVRHIAFLPSALCLLCFFVADPIAVSRMKPLPALLGLSTTKPCYRAPLTNASRKHARRLTVFPSSNCSSQRRS